MGSIEAAIIPKNQSPLDVKACNAATEVHCFAAFFEV